MTPVLPLEPYLLLSAVLFAIGAVGVIVKRNPIIMFMFIELMLNAVNLTLIAFSRYYDQFPAPSPGMADAHPMQHGSAGQMMVIFVMAVAAAEVAVGLGIIVSIFRNRDSINIDSMDVMRG